MSKDAEALHAIAAALKTHARVGIICHVSPDPDTLGAAYAVAEALDQVGIACCVYCSDVIPGKYLELLAARFCVTEAEALDACDVILALDCGDMGRLGRAAQHVGEKPLYVIDHHESNPRYGTMNAVFPDAGSTCEVLGAFIEALGAVITPAMASDLYRGIVTDTGRFGFQSTTPESLRVAAGLMEAGADFEKIVRSEYRVRSLPRTRLLGAAIGTLQMHFDGRVAVMHVTRAMMAECEAVPAMTDGIVNYGVEIEGAQVGLLLTERPDGLWKVSLRSLDEVHINGVAVALGGGGHEHAAGCTLQGDLDSAVAQLLALVEQELA